MQEKKDLKSRVGEWLSKQGYPLEFKVANVFKKGGFAVHQGTYVNDFKTGQPRELDVVADWNEPWYNGFLRISYVIECKWSGEKPWVIFTDQTAQISPGACVAQSVGSESARSILSVLAADPDVLSLSMFHVPARPGFNGRQALGSQNDLVYNTLQSIMSACYSKKKFYDSYHDSPMAMMSMTVAIFPIIVIDGGLFEAYYNTEKNDVDLVEREMIRLHWKGSEAWNAHSTIDIVTVEHLPNYVATLSSNTGVLSKKMEKVHQIITDCIQSKSLAPLSILPLTRRGEVNVPPILFYLKTQNGDSAAPTAE